MAYEIRKWPDGESPELGLSVTDLRGRIVFSSPSYDACKTERDRLNAGGSERTPLAGCDERHERLPDGTVRRIPLPRTPQFIAH
jgi:hypothetical protein